MGITAIELAKGEPPNAELHPMRVLFLIPKNNPPQLDSQFSKNFREFVGSCLHHDPTYVSTIKGINANFLYHYSLSIITVHL